MTSEQLIQAIDEGTLVPTELSGYELFILVHTKHIKMARAEARRRIEAQGLQQTQYGWLTREEIGILGISLTNGRWTDATAEALNRWLSLRKTQKENEKTDRIMAKQSVIKMES